MLAAGCESKSASVDPVPDKQAVQMKPVIPFEERKFIYINGITIISKETNEKDENGVKVVYNYPVISGLKNKEVQDKLNKEFLNVEKQQLSKLKVKMQAAAGGKYKLNQMTANSYISYNCNNVIFVDYHTNVDVRLAGYNNFPTYNYACYGYDLNTGERIKFNDIFKPGNNYKDKINNYISQYLIENNYDDYEYDRMTKPFQGIMENQSFNFSTEDLIILFDEKNDEFVNYGYPEQVRIPLKYIGDDLYIFDRYFDENQNIFVKGKLSKKLMTNKIEFKADKLIHEETGIYFISVPQGKFINVPDKDIEKKLNELAMCKFDIEDFKKKAKELASPNRPFYYAFNVNIYMNAGGYISVGAMEGMDLGEKYESDIVPFNYDFNSGKEMRLEDIFEDMADIEAELKKHALQINYSASEEVLDNAIKEAVKAEKFYFHEYGVNIYIPIENSELYNEQKWVWIPFQEINEDNIRLFKQINNYS